MGLSSLWFERGEVRQHVRETGRSILRESREAVTEKSSLNLTEEPIRKTHCAALTGWEHGKEEREKSLTMYIWCVYII